MQAASAGREQTGWASEIRALRREPQLLLAIGLLFLMFAVFIIYPFIKLILVPSALDWASRWFRALPLSCCSGGAASSLTTFWI